MNEIVLVALVLCAGATTSDAKAPRTTAPHTSEPVPPPPAAQQLRISAQVDKTHADVGDRVTLTITLTGPFMEAQLQPMQLPDELRVIAQRQASQVSMQLGHVERSMSLVYLLAPQAPGKFPLGPFHVNYQGQTASTEPITIDVAKPALPPNLQKQPQPRYYL